MSSINRWRVWILSLLCWSILAVVDSGGSYTLVKVSGAQPDVVRVLGWNFSHAYFWALFTPLIYIVALNFGFSRESWRKSLAVHLALCLAVTVVLSSLFIGWNTLLGWADVSTPFRVRLVDMSLENIPRCLATMGVAHALAYYVRLSAREKQTARLESELAKAQLENLKSQLEPHFLFNTLNSIAALSRKDPASAERMILQLASLLRVSLDWSGLQEIPLEQELRFLQNYLAIQQTRFQDRLRVRVDVNPELLSVFVPSLLLQPLVENSIRHGIAKSSVPGRLGITIGKQQDFLKIEIGDNGVGVLDSAGDGRGFGLRNTRARLKQLYGEDHTLDLRNVPGGGCLLTLRIPVRRSQLAGD